MTLESTIAENKYDGNGVQTVFAFTFKVWETDEVIAKVDDVLQVHDSDVTVAITDADAGTGTCTFGTPPPAGTDNVWLKRAVEQKQESTFPLRAKLDSEELEELLDRMVAMTQDNTRDLEAYTFNWRGTWSASKNYSDGDAVFWDGSSYRCIAAHTNQEPPNTTYWTVVAQQGDAGGLTWQGAWDSGTSYAVGDGVSHEGSSYICIATSTNNEPPNATYWNLLAEAGVDGEMSGPSSAVDNNFVTFDGTDGGTVQDSGVGAPTLTSSDKYKKLRADSTGIKMEAMNEAPSTLTIASGSITPTKAVHLVDTEGAASTDDIDNIVTSGVEDGHRLIIFAANGSRDVVVKHNSGGTGNIFLVGDADKTIDDDEKALMLIRNGDNWYEAGWNSGEAAITVNVSSDQTLTAAASRTASHGLGTYPKLWGAFLRCTATDANYAVGDKVDSWIGNDGTYAYLPPSIYATISVVGVRMPASSWGVGDKTSGAYAGITATKWKLVLWWVA